MPGLRTYHLPHITALFCMDADRLYLTVRRPCHGADSVVFISGLEGQR